MMKPRVYVTRAVPEEGFDVLQKECEVEVWAEERPVPRQVLLKKVSDIEGLYCLLTERVDEALLDAAPALRVVSNMAVGYDNVDVDACTGRGIPVGNTPGVLTDTTADLAFALLMTAARRIVAGADYVRAGKWKTWGPMLLMGQDVYGATLGIVGMGRIGQTVARRTLGFDMRILYHDPYVAEADLDMDATRVDMDTLLTESDFVTLHVPLTEATYHLIGRDELDMMKPTATLINASRGGVVDHDALYDALREGQIGNAGLDVTEPEPIPADHPLLSLPNCIVVPHIGSASVATRTKMAMMASENLLAGLRGHPLPHCVNPQVQQTG
ncbi:MAG: D-glycerate dehydrogenase [Anaerolineae bacterium]|jgi:lactate dehydrogenase-like 2-hydroxyacid dehydrogenase